MELHGTEGTGEFTSQEAPPHFTCFKLELEVCGCVSYLCVPGKTELLYHLLCRCVMPVETGGLEVEVVFVDTDFSLDMLRLVSILDSRLNAGTHT